MSEPTALQLAESLCLEFEQVLAECEFSDKRRRGEPTGMHVPLSSSWLSGAMNIPSTRIAMRLWVRDFRAAQEKARGR